MVDPILGMKTIHFTIHGNQNDPMGNPTPYKRTLRGHFRPDARDYFQWKEYVRRELFLGATDDMGDRIDIRFSYPDEYPLLSAPKEPVAVHMKIWWNNGHHGDGDNIFKGIVDAILKDDKCVWAGSFESRLDPEKKGRVEVVIEIGV